MLTYIVGLSVIKITSIFDNRSTGQEAPENHRRLCKIKLIVIDKTHQLPIINLKMRDERVRSDFSVKSR